MEVIYILWFVSILLGVGIVWILPAYLVGVAARNKSRNFASFFFLSLLVSWIIMAIIVAALPYSDAPGAIPTPRRRCPDCDESISVRARVCMHCRSSVLPVMVPTANDNEKSTRAVKRSKQPEYSSQPQESFTRPTLSGLSAAEISELLTFYSDDLEGFIDDTMTSEDIIAWNKAGAPDLAPWITSGLPNFQDWIRRT